MCGESCVGAGVGSAQELCQSKASGHEVRSGDLWRGESSLVWRVTLWLAGLFTGLESFL